MITDGRHADVTSRIIRAAIEVHRVLGHGLLESAYETCLAHEMTLRGLPYRTQVALPVEYKGTRLDCGYRMDIVVDDRIVVELKTVDLILPVHEAQLLTYLRLSGIRVGLLLNFHAGILAKGICRRVL
jgi:GxxExxY protein